MYGIFTYIDDPAGSGFWNNHYITGWYFIPYVTQTTIVNLSLL